MVNTFQCLYIMGDWFWFYSKNKIAKSSEQGSFRHGNPSLSLYFPLLPSELAIPWQFLGGEEQPIEDLEGAALTYEEDEVIGGDDGEFLERSLVIQWLLLAPKREEPPQRHNIFKTRCIVNQRVCDLIIDNGSSENVVSKKMVEKLGLKTEKHPAPYKLGWITCSITFSIGKKTYVDKVICDVVDMNACHMILERPWQYDVDATHRGRDNVYFR